MTTESEADVKPGGSGAVPRHGFSGSRPAAPTFPASLTIAVSREAGSRGGSIARRVGRKLGWQVYNQELLDTIAQEGAFAEGVVTNLTAEASAWAEEYLQGLRRQHLISEHPNVHALARIVLALSAQGEVVLLGRGAGCLLPRETTLHVRIMAPQEDRIAYMSQWLRLTVEQAAEQVRLRDGRRADFIRTHFRREPTEVYQYDILLNSSYLGEDQCAELIAQAARAKLAARGQWAGAPPPWVAETVE